MINSPPAVTSRSVWSASGEPGAHLERRLAGVLAHHQERAAGHSRRDRRGLVGVVKVERFVGAVPRIVERPECRYRQHLKDLIEPLLDKWQRRLGGQVSECRIMKMKTKWGTCSVDARRIWLNLELAKKPVQCTEYVLVHELVHLLERHHSDRFVAIMNQSLPQWRVIREELNAAPLAHEAWSY